MSILDEPILKLFPTPDNCKQNKINAVALNFPYPTV